MSIFLILPLLFSWCFFVVCQYSDILCNSDDASQNAEMQSTCVEFQNSHLDKAYGAQEIRVNSGCKHAWVALLSDDDLQYLWIGICHLSPDYSICVTAAPQGNLQVWKRMRTPKEGYKNRLLTCHPDYTT